MTNQLGQLELEVMEQVWLAPGIEAKELTEIFNQQTTRLTLSTMQSTVERLVRKGLLERRKVSHAYQYHACISRQNLLARLMGDVIQLLHDGRMDTILSSFVSVAANLDAASLDRLERLIEDKKCQLKTAGDAEKESPGD
ncbi:MAG: BlaI/MecI/CopY family transcriptional regulator [Pseudohongiellaceae bacterium]